MNKLLIISMGLLSIISCKKNSTPAPLPETYLKGGTWNLTKSKKGNDAWKDSVGLFYKFTNDTTVITNRYNPTCDGKYEGANSGSQRTVFTNFDRCKPSANFAFSIEKIETNYLLINYLDEVAGVIVQFKEQYVRQ